MLGALTFCRLQLMRLVLLLDVEEYMLMHMTITLIPFQITGEYASDLCSHFNNIHSDILIQLLSITVFLSISMGLFLNLLRTQRCLFRNLVVISLMSFCWHLNVTCIFISIIQSEKYVHRRVAHSRLSPCLSCWGLVWFGFGGHACLNVNGQFYFCAMISAVTSFRSQIDAILVKFFVPLVFCCNI